MLSLSGIADILSLIGGALVGFVAGMLSGMFGIGGGIIMSPGSRLFLGVTSMVAVSTSLLVVIPTSIVGAFSYTRNKLTDLRTGIILGIAGAVVSPFGAMLSHKIGGDIVMVGTAGLLLTAAYTTWRSYKTACRKDDEACRIAAAALDAEELTEALAEDSENNLSLSRRRYVLSAILIGMITGFFSGVFGVGGGFIIVPALVAFLGIPIKKAIGTSLIAVGILAIPGIITHASYGTVDYALAALLTIGVIPGSRVGAKITFIASERKVTAAFAIFLVIAGVSLAVSQLISMGIL